MKGTSPTQIFEKKYLKRGCTFVAGLDEAGRALLTRAAEAGHLTARGWTRTLRLARTIADLDGSGPVRRLHVAEALIYRRTNVGAEGSPVLAGP